VPPLRRAVAIAEKNMGPDHPEVATHLGDLAAMLHLSDRLAEAEPLFRRALAITEKNLGPDHPEVATYLRDLALLLHESGRLVETEPLMRRAIQIFEQFERNTGQSHPDTKLVRDNLAAIEAELNERAGRAASMPNSAHPSATTEPRQRLTRPSFWRRLFGRT
jgi:tetratricopeptide (TPR) repeat protein